MSKANGGGRSSLRTSFSKIQRRHQLYGLGNSINHFVVQDITDAALRLIAADDVEWLGPFSCQTASDRGPWKTSCDQVQRCGSRWQTGWWRARKRANTWIVSARYFAAVTYKPAEAQHAVPGNTCYLRVPFPPDGPRIVHLHQQAPPVPDRSCLQLSPGQNAIRFPVQALIAPGSAAEAQLRDTTRTFTSPSSSDCCQIRRSRCVIRHAHGSSRCEAPWQAWKGTLPARTSFACTAIV